MQKKWLDSKQYLLLYTLGGGIFSAMLVWLHLSPWLLVLFVPPVCLAAQRYPRRVYLASTVLVALLALGVAGTASNPLAALSVAVTIGITVLISAELSYRTSSAQRASNENYRQFVQHLGGIVYRTTGTSFDVIFIEGTVEQITGYTAEDFIANRVRWERLVYPEDLPGVQPIVNKMLAIPGFIANLEYRIRRKDGALVWVNDISQCLWNAAGQVVYTQGSVFDITHLKQVEEALRLSEAYNRAVIENSPLGISVRARNGKLLICNRAWQKIWAVPDEAVQEDMSRERNALVFDHRDQYLGPYLAQVEQIYTQGGSLYIPELKTDSTRPGAAEWVAQYFYAIIDERGEVNRVVILTQDITERKYMADALLESEERYRELINRLGEGICIVDPEEWFMFANPAIEHIFGVPAGGLENRNLCEFTSPEQFKKLQQQTEKCSLGEKSTYEMEIARADGEIRHLWVTATPYFDAQKNFAGSFGILLDITERKRAEQAESEQRALADALRDATAALNSTLQMDEVFDRILESVGKVVPHDSANIAIINPDTTITQFVRSQDVGKHPNPTTPLANSHLNEVPTFAQMIATGRPVIASNVKEYPGWKPLSSSDWVQSYAGAPIFRRGQVVGFLSLNSATPGFFHQGHAERLRIFADQAAIAINNAWLYAAVQRLAIVDELTGIYNYRGLLEFGQREVDRAQRFARPLCALYFDIDHFRDFNNRYSHAIGNLVLRAVAECSRAAVRSVDLTARYGGEEFVILLPEIDLFQAVEVAERLRASIQALQVATPRGSLGVTISIGVAQLTSATPDLATLIDRADHAEHRAKDNGRNRVEFFQ